MTHYDKIKKIAGHYGFRHQAIKTSEECSELSAAMSKLVNGEGGRAAVIEEMADVRIMLRQMEYLMGIQKAELYAAMDAKVDRQLERIKSDKAIDKSEKSSIMKNYQKLQLENQWYQELYDKARKAQIASAEEAEALRRENEQLRAALQERRGA